MFELKISKPKPRRGISFMVTPEEHELFEKRVREHHVSKSKVLREFVRAFADGKIGVTWKD
jgi:hypothetical protein